MIFVGHCQGFLTVFPENQQCVLFAIKAAQIAPYPVCRNHIQILARQFVLGVLFKVMGFCGKSDRERAVSELCDFRQNIPGFLQGQRGLLGLFFIFAFSIRAGL